MADRAYLLHSLSHLAINRTKAKDDVTKQVTTSQEILATAKTVFPFTLFPDTVSVDRTNLTIAHRTFYKVASIISIKVDDILNITPNVGPFFGSLRISTVFVDKASPYVVNYLPREDALRISRIIKGYKVALEKKLDTDTLSKEELVKLLDRLARDGTDV
jgi:hypothetical protein